MGIPEKVGAVDKPLRPPPGGGRGCGVGRGGGGWVCADLPGSDAAGEKGRCSH